MGQTPGATSIASHVALTRRFGAIVGYHGGKSSLSAADASMAMPPARTRPSHTRSMFARAATAYFTAAAAAAAAAGGATAAASDEEGEEATAESPTDRGLDK